VAADEVVLVTCGVVRRDRTVLAEVGWGLVVADEAQHAKNPLSRTARELRAIPAPARVALTGTSVENRLTELWSILDWTTPGLLGPLERFRRSVASASRYRSTGTATERLTRVVRPFLLRRRKSDPRIAPELPAKTETDRVVPLTAEQATLYEAVVRETLADRPVQVHRLVTEGTLEDHIAALLASKRDLAEAVVGAGEAWITELSDAELAELVTLQGPP
jgi:SNF2 family DNA or RNA helicase